jgi:DMSO/TMAO reductase YedYZ molybdopterin-dependent catalytic subunit
VDLASWNLKVDGHLSSPVVLSMNDLRSMPSSEIVGVLECAGNGRGFYDPPVAGLQWGNGAVGNGRWRGVRLAEVLKRVDVKPGAVEVLFDGADVPIGEMADFQRSIPIRKALHPDTLLAYEMNGEALTSKHGFPLRAVVPGWAGDSWVKWITGVTVTDQESKGFWMKNAYLHPGKPVAPGSAVAADAMSPVTSLRVKSVIASPSSGAILESGKPAVIHGAAWTGDGGRIAGVEVSIDQGRTWKSAQLTGPSSAYGWRLWNLPWTPSGERHFTLLVRARDSSGDVQPAVQEWNPSGYLWNSFARVDVDSVRSPGAPASADSVPSSTLEPPQGFRETCLTCHDEDVIRQQRLTRAQWDRELNKMTNWGARVPPDRRESFLDYLVNTAGPRR